MSELFNKIPSGDVIGSGNGLVSSGNKPLAG